MSPPHKILIIRLSSLGDILHTLPAFQSLRESFPQAQIDWVVERKSSVLLSAVEGIHRVVELDTRLPRQHPMRRESWKPLLTKILEMRARGYDVSLDFQGLLKTGILGLFGGARSRLGFSAALVRERPAHWFYHRRLEHSGDVHVVELNLALTAMAGARHFPTRTGLRSRPEDEQAVERLIGELKLREFVVINPGGGWATKRWPPERYAALADRLRDRLGMQVVITTGPGEEDLYRLIRRHSANGELAHMHLTFLQLIPLMRRAQLVIGGDTGPFHLACALGTPVVGIFGPTSPQRNGAWHTRAEMVWRTLPCSYCYGRTCPTRNECMDVPVADVYEAVRRCISRLS